MATPPRISCNGCDRLIPPGAHYVVKIDVFADPSLPPITSEELQESDYEATMAKLLSEMETLSVDELQDGVARRFGFTLCRACQLRYLADPLAKKRLTPPGPQSN